MSRIARLIPLALTLGTVSNMFGASRIFAVNEDPEEDKAILNEIFTPEVKEAIKAHLQILADKLKEATQPIFDAETLEATSAAKEYFDNNRPEFVLTNEIIYNVLSAAVDAVVEKYGAELSEEEKDVEAVTIFNAVFRDVINNMEEAVQEYGQELTHKLFVKMAKAKILQSKASAATDEKTTEHTVATTGDVSAQPTATDIPETGETGAVVSEA